MRRADLAVLKHSQFRRLFIARSVSVLGSSVAGIALAFAILDLPTATPSKLGEVLAAMAVARVVFILVGGVLGDRFSRSTILSLGEFLSALGSLGLGVALLSHTHNFLLLSGLAAIVGIGTGIFMPAMSGMVADVVDESQLRSANGLLRLVLNTVSVGGVGLAGFIVATIGGAWAMLLNSAAFLVSMLLLFSIKSRPMPRSKDSMFKQLRGGWKEFSSRSWIVSIVAAAFVINAFFGAVIGVFGPIIAKSQLGGPAAWGLITMTFSAGAIVGTFVALRIKSHRPLLLGVVCTAGIGLPALALAVPMPVAIIALAGFLASIGLDIFSLGWDTALQLHIPREALSRVSAYDWLGSMVAVPLGLAVAGSALQAVGARTALLYSGGIMIVVALLPLLVPSVRTLTNDVSQST
ncbi:MAG TPA: MFS transporter [Candidatus Nanopelagicaceae bacterium]|nr:MFS transporter [Candidatus Nanopelagicaceae bacterium]